MFYLGRKRKRKKNLILKEGLNIAMQDRTRYCDSEGEYTPLFWPNPNVYPTKECGTNTASALLQTNINNMMHTPPCVCPDSRVVHRSGSATVRRLRTNPDVCITRKRTKNKISGLKYIQYIVQCTECGGAPRK